MSAVLTTQYGESESNVLSFRPIGVRTSPERAFDPQEYFQGGNTIEQAAAMIHAMVTQQVMEGQLRSRPSPFDAVYFSALQPDAVSVRALNALQRFRSIVDASDEIEFDDGMD